MNEVSGEGACLAHVDVDVFPMVGPRSMTDVRFEDLGVHTWAIGGVLGYGPCGGGRAWPM